MKEPGWRRKDFPTQACFGRSSFKFFDDSLFIFRELEVITFFLRSIFLLSRARCL